MHQILPGAQIPFGGLHRGMAQQHLDLLKFAARGPAQLRASAPQVVRRDAWSANFACILFEHLPDDLLPEVLAGDGATTIHWPENMTVGNARSRSPRVDRHLHPRRHRRGPNASVFANEIDNVPASVSLLKMSEREGRYF